MDAILRPNLKITVIDDRVANVITQDRLTDRLRLLLIGELGGMHADHDQLLGVLLLQFLQVGNDVHAVDAAEGPEVQKNQLAAQIVQRQRPVRVQPPQMRRKTGSARVPFELSLHHLVISGDQMIGRLCSCVSEVSAAAGHDQARYHKTEYGNDSWRPDTHTSCVTLRRAEWFLTWPSMG
jgi:hypothetical protein